MTDPSPALKRAIQHAQRAFPYLPDAGFEGRWTVLRKFHVTEALRLRRLSRSQVMAAYGIQKHELANWTDRCERLGLDGLALTKLQLTGR